MDADRNYLLSLQAVRDQASKVLVAAKQGSLKHFDFNESRMIDVADFVYNVIERDFGPDKYDTIPPHGRWQHFEVGSVPRLDSLIKRWSDEKDEVEVTRRLIDLFFVSVVLDAGAGDFWQYTEPDTNQVVMRSEGIAVASLHMFTAGAFSSRSYCKETVDGKGLVQLQDADLNKHFQVSIDNPFVGVSSRVQLLKNIGSSLLSLPAVFGESGRPGNLVDYLLLKASGSKVLDFEQLWSCLQDVLIPSWPKDRTVFDGKPIGDAWSLDILAEIAEEQGDNKKAVSKIQPFHKLTQWLAYSLSVPFERQLGYSWKNIQLGTGLPEYRNGGLFIDLGVLVLRAKDLEEGQKSSGTKLPQFGASSDTVVEWRAMTVILLDELHKIIEERFKPHGVTLSLAQMLEAGSWKSGRELAAKLRPDTKCSPILVISDGTLY
ncbi:urg3 [Fusarium pseudocircinatum]|uniref:Urg3 n=1 Tax=Fusarium pseudocircinatum TaxID=56676 RepID=A0A8H5KHL0_9HYPO|nr:urg3 [Fusarium pseudocircinatum]